MVLSIAIPLVWVNIYLICGILVAELFRTHSHQTHGPNSVGNRFGPYLAVVMLWAIIVPVAVATVVFGSASRTRS